jgi:hypothetical protein
MRDPLREIITPEVIERWIEAPRTPELVDRLEIATARGELPHHPVDRSRVRFLRARRVMWDTYLSTGEQLGLMDNELIGRLRSPDADNFRPAIAECMAAWYLSGRLQLTVVPRPAGRGRTVLEMAIKDAAGDIAVEVKSPAMPERPAAPAAVVQPVRAEFEEALRKANRQFPKTGRNLLIVVPRRSSMLTTVEYELVRALIGEHIISFSIDSNTGGAVGESSTHFWSTGRLTRGDQPFYTRVGAVLCLEEFPVTRFPSAADLFFTQGARSAHTLNAANARYFADDNAARVDHAAVAVHNPNSQEAIAPDMFGSARQLVVVPGGMRWVGTRPW